MVPFGRPTRENISIEEGSLYRYMIDNDSSNRMYAREDVVL